MENQNFYPKAYENLLIKCGLIGAGEVVLKGIVSKDTQDKFDEKSQTWSKGESPKIDNSRLTCFVSPVFDNNGNILGDWKIGLTKEETDIISTFCKVPIFDEDYMVYFQPGIKFNLRNPVDFAVYRILLYQDHIARDEKSLTSKHSHYLYMPEESAKDQAIIRSSKRKAFDLDGELTPERKRQILSVIFYNEGLSYPTMGDDDLRDSFTDYCDNYPTKIVEINGKEDLQYRSFLAKAISIGAVFSDKGGFKHNNGVLIADTFDNAVIALIKEKVHVNKINSILEKRTSVVNDSDPVPSVVVVKKYNTTIYDENVVVSTWNEDMCLEYIKEHNIAFDPVSSKQELIRIVLEHYKNASKQEAVKKK